MAYYLFIDGQRYDAALIRSAQLISQGSSDGRISKADAQNLWRQATDSGRFTETEEKTIRYLIDHFNWAPAAQEWVETTLQEHIIPPKSYYKVIDGLRYDRLILEEAKARICGRSDQRLSFEDAQFLLTLFGETGDIRIEEERALEYLLNHYDWSDQARAWFLSRVNAISRESDFYSQVTSIIQYQFRLERLYLELDREELRRQTLQYPNEVLFLRALQRALRCLFQYDELESLRQLTMELYDLYSEEVEHWEVLLEHRIRQLMGNARLMLLGESALQADHSISQEPPPKGETLAHNWIFGLKLYNLEQYFTWIIVDRQDEIPAYNYAIKRSS